MDQPDSPEQLRNAGLVALRARDFGRAASLLGEAARFEPGNPVVWPALANAEMALGRLDAAEAAIDRRLEQAPRDIGAVLLKGYLREQAGDARSASSFYQLAVAQVQADGTVPPGLNDLFARARHYLDASSSQFSDYLQEQLGGGLSPVMQEAVELLLGKRGIDLQQPSVFYYPGLPQRRFYEPDQFSWLAPMLALVPRMQQELDAMWAGREAGFEPYVRSRPNRPAPNNPLLGDPAWSVFWFWQDGRIVPENAESCPATMEALAHAPMPRIPGRAPNAHWSVLRSGAHIAPHVGMLNTRLICHIPIRTAPGCTLRVGSETRIWEDGRALVFDDSMEHEARNAGPEVRVILLFEIWRPEIGEEDREVLSRIFQAIDSYGTG